MGNLIKKTKETIFHKQNRFYIFASIVFCLLLVSIKVLFKEEAMPIYQWYTMLFVIGIPFLPITMKLFSNFHDKGYIFSKTIAIVITSLIFFWLSSFKLVKFTSIGTILVFIMTSIVAILLVEKFVHNKEKLTRDNLKLIVIEELVVLALFIVLMYIKAFNPSAYGTEKFMDYGFMSSMMLTDYFPVEDFWFSGTPLNYYYIGQYIMTFLTKLCFGKVEYTYNLSLMTICAIAFVQVFSITFHLLCAKLQNKGKKTYHIATIGATIAGIAVCFMGNMHYVIYKWILPWANKTFDLGLELTKYWFPNSTRYIGYVPDVDDKTIHEFPSYSFILGDLHAHVVNIIFVLTIVGILIAFAFHYKDCKNEKLPNTIKDICKTIFSPYIILCGILIGLFHGTNYWDFPIYFIVSGAIILFTNYRRFQFSIKTTLLTLVEGIVVLGIGALTILPFTLNFSKMASEICIAQKHSAFYQLLILWGFPIILCILGFIYNIVEYKKGKKKEIKKKKRNKQKTKEKISFKMVIDKYIKESDLSDLIIVLISLCAIGLIIGPELVYVKDIYGDTYARCNTMFKLVYQAFILFGICIGYYITTFFFANSNKVKKTISLIAFVLFVSCTGYFITSCNAWFGNIFKSESYKSINSLYYLSHDSTFEDDVYMIDYINNNIDGKPIILEANGLSYTSYNRISVATGKPTVLGWYTHEWLWKDNLAIVQQRDSDIKTIYTTMDIDELIAMIEKYDISYIYVGHNEYLKYESINLSLIEQIATVECLVPSNDEKTYTTYLYRIEKDKMETLKTQSTLILEPEER